MKLLKLGAAALNQTPLDWNRNRDNIQAVLRQARAQGIQILCLPELCITGYGCEDLFLSPDTQKRALELLEELLPATEDLVVCMGIPLFYRRALFNVSAVVANAQILGFVAKRDLPGDGVHYEPRWFKPWPAGEVAQIQIGKKSYPLGDLHFDLGGVRLGIEICEEAWVAQRRAAELARFSVDIILNPSASHFAFGKHRVRQRLVEDSSRAFGVAYVYTNLLGNEAGRIIYDGDAMIACGGTLLASARRLSFAGHELVSADVDLEKLRMVQSQVFSFAPWLDASAAQCVALPYEFRPSQEKAPPLEVADWEASSSLKEEEFTRAVALGLFDYLRKSKSSGFMLSLSGGVDSSAVACLVALMVKLATRELGSSGLVEKLAHISGLVSARNDRERIAELLTTLYQPTRHSSVTTREAARGLSEALGARHYEIDVDPMFEEYVQRVSGVLGRSLSWQTEDVALQNIQARVRAPAAWMLSNLRSLLLLTTSNRSEISVGYTTMDGDTAGGLAPLAGVDKVFLRRWLKWLETRGPEGFGPIAALACVTVQAPTAELRPQASLQTDESDLMPYEILEEIEAAVVRDRQGPKGAYLRVRAGFPSHSPEQALAFVECFFGLYCRNQWKRERLAPSFHLDDRNLDPRSFCRFPILSGGFERELQELRAEVERG